MLKAFPFVPLPVCTLHHAPTCAPARVLFQACPAGGDQRPLLYTDPRLERPALSTPRAGPWAAAHVHGIVPASTGAIPAAPPEPRCQGQEEPPADSGRGVEATQQDGSDVHRRRRCGHDWHGVCCSATLPPLLPGEAAHSSWHTESAGTHTCWHQQRKEGETLALDAMLSDLRHIFTCIINFMP